MSRNVLVADDSLTIRKVIGMIFATEDVQLTAVDNGIEAISKARELKPDLVMADVVMPGKNGYEVCEALKSDPQTQGVPVLLLAGTFEAFDEARARTVRADAHIMKPFESQALLEKYRALTGATLGAKPAAAPARPAPQQRPSAPVPVQMPPGPRPMPPMQNPAYRPAIPGGMPQGVIAPMPGIVRPGMMHGPPRPGAAPAGIPPRPAPPGGAIPKAMVRPVIAGPFAARPLPQGMPNRAMSPAVAMPRPPMPAGAMPGPTQRRDPFAFAAPQAARDGAILPPAAQQHEELSLDASDGNGAATSLARPAAPRATDEAALLREALSKASREMIEKIAWEVVPQLAETIIREELDRLIKERETKH